MEGEDSDLPGVLGSPGPRPSSGSRLACELGGQPSLCLTEGALRPALLVSLVPAEGRSCQGHQRDTYSQAAQHLTSVLWGNLGPGEAPIWTVLTRCGFPIPPTPHHEAKAFDSLRLAFYLPGERARLTWAQSVTVQRPQGYPTEALGEGSSHPTQDTGVEGGRWRGLRQLGGCWFRSVMADEKGQGEPSTGQGPSRAPSKCPKSPKDREALKIRKEGLLEQLWSNPAPLTEWETGVQRRCSLAGEEGVSLGAFWSPDSNFTVCYCVTSSPNFPALVGSM